MKHLHRKAHYKFLGSLLCECLAAKWPLPLKCLNVFCADSIYFLPKLLFAHVVQPENNFPWNMWNSPGKALTPILFGGRKTNATLAEGEMLKMMPFYVRNLHHLPFVGIYIAISILILRNGGTMVAAIGEREGKLWKFVTLKAHYPRFVVNNFWMGLPVCLHSMPWAHTLPENINSLALNMGMERE